MFYVEKGSTFFPSNAQLVTLKPVTEVTQFLPSDRWEICWICVGPVLCVLFCSTDSSKFPCQFLTSFKRCLCVVHSAVVGNLSFPPFFPPDTSCLYFSFFSCVLLTHYKYAVTGSFPFHSCVRPAQLSCISICWSPVFPSVRSASLQEHLRRKPLSRGLLQN